jgi:hypothetical protein
VAAVGDAVHRQPLDLRRQDWERGRRRGDLHLAGRKDVTAVRAFSRRKCDDAVAFRAELGRGLTATGLAGPSGRTRSIGPWRRTLPAKSRTRQFSLPGARRVPRPTICT